jgi:hypothetical protein
MLFSAVKHLRADRFFEWSRKVLDVPGHTVELRTLGMRIILTDNPDNVKAVLSTKVVLSASSVSIVTESSLVLQLRKGGDDAQSLAGFDA